MTTSNFQNSIKKEKPQHFFHLCQRYFWKFSTSKALLAVSLLSKLRCRMGCASLYLGIPVLSQTTVWILTWSYKLLQQYASYKLVSRFAFLEADWLRLVWDWLALSSDWSRKVRLPLLSCIGQIIAHNSSVCSSMSFHVEGEVVRPERVKVSKTSRPESSFERIQI